MPKYIVYKGPDRLNDNHQPVPQYRWRLVEDDGQTFIEHGELRDSPDECFDEIDKRNDDYDVDDLTAGQEAAE